MKVSRECIHCLARQAGEIAEEAASNVRTQEEIIKRSLKELAEMDFMARVKIEAFTNGTVNRIIGKYVFWMRSLLSRKLVEYRYISAL
jgi:uncharacterized protein with ATP-grasp and redox domains